VRERERGELWNLFRQAFNRFVNVSSLFFLLILVLLYVIASVWSTLYNMDCQQEPLGFEETYIYFKKIYIKLIIF
jgi:hypothetical protein